MSDGLVPRYRPRGGPNPTLASILLRLVALLPMLAAVACGNGGQGNAVAGGDSDSGGAGAGAGATESTAAPFVRSADAQTRGLSEADFPRVQQLADGVYSYEQLVPTGRPEEPGRFTTVSLFVVTSEGVLVADGQRNDEEVGQLMDAVATVTDQPITHVVICSDHGDHTGGNAAFPSDAVFYAHPTSAAVLQASAERARQREGARPVVVPTEMVEDQTVLSLGGKEIRLTYLGRAHTGGDLSVYLPAEKVMFMSEAYFNRVFPAMRSAFPSEWIDVIERAQAMDVDVYVPGHGFVESPTILKEELETYQSALRRVIDEVRRLHAAGVDVDAAIDQARFGDLEGWTLRDSQGPIAVRRIYMELNGELPPAPGR